MLRTFNYLTMTHKGVTVGHRADRTRLPQRTRNTDPMSRALLSWPGASEDDKRA